MTSQMEKVNAISDEFGVIKTVFQNAFNGLKEKYGVNPTLKLKDGIGLCYDFDYDQMLAAVSSKESPDCSM